MNDLLPQMSEKFDVVLAQLMKAKAEMDTVKKDSTNPFHKSSYASLGAYIEASEQHLTKNGLILVQAVNGTFSQPMIIATLLHPESGQWIKSYMPILNPKNDSQGLGASVTYMRRYSIATLLGLVAEDDDGETASGRGKFDKGPKKATTEPQNVDENLKKLLAMFDKEDKFLIQEYIKTVATHFEWSEAACIAKFLEEKDLMVKFNNWKAKRK